MGNYTTPADNTHLEYILSMYTYQYIHTHTHTHAHTYNQTHTIYIYIHLFWTTLFKDYMYDGNNCKVGII